MPKILVIGDSCTDIFQYGTCERMCPEAPVPIFKPTKLNTSAGMSINVANNVKSLGVDCDIITNDFRPAKTRYLDEVSNQLLLRIDVNDRINPIEWDVLDGIKFDDYDAVVISDYNKGYLHRDHIEFITKRHDVVFMDSKKKLGDWIMDANFVKINKKEFVENWDHTFDFKGDLVVTLGKDGADLNKFKHFSIENEHDVRDLSGAGDTFLAGLVVEYLKNKNIEDAINFANKCSAWVVTQKGVVAVNPELI